MNISNTTVKRYGLVLLLLLSASVVVFSPSASAQVATADRATADDSISLNSTTTVTVEVETDGSGNGFQIDDTFTGDIADASGTVVNDAGGNILTEIVSNSGSLILVGNPDPNSTFVYEYTLESVNSSTLNGKTGSISVTDGVTSDLTMDTDTITVQQFQATRTISSDFISTNESTTVEVTVQTDSKGSDFQIDDNFAGNITAASGTVINDAGGDVVSQVVDTQGSIVTVNSPDPNSQFVYEYSLKSTSDTALSGTNGAIKITDGTSSDVIMGAQNIIINTTVPSNRTYSSKTVAQFDDDNDGKINQRNLGQAGQKYLNGGLTQLELGKMGQAYLRSS